MLTKQRTLVLAVALDKNGRLSEPSPQLQPESRATRLVAADGARASETPHFATLSIPRKIARSEEETLWRHLSTLMKDGMVLNNFRYAFLGYTESGLKSGNFIFLRETNRWTVASVLAAFGSVVSVYYDSGYAKFSARLGMSFSSTIQGLQVERHKACLIKDFSADDGSVTTDGCGLIRESFARSLCSQRGLSPSTTVFQIRWGGVKGILVRYPDDIFDQICSPGKDVQQHRYHIAYRPSMLKYKGGPTTVELHEISESPAPARLNHMFIVLLLSLGVSVNVFKKKMSEQLARLGSITHDLDVARSFIKGELDAEGGAFDQELFELLLAVHDMKEPYVQSLLRKFLNNLYDGLRKKLNICVHQSCYLFGVVDESGILDEDQVFVNLPEFGGSQVRKVLVTRNPAYASGDMRVLKAVHVPELSHLTNCIVFPRRGMRSLPDQMAGGDLDGDKYFVCWDPELIPPRSAEPLERTVKPAKPVPPSPQSTSSGFSLPPMTRSQEVAMRADALEVFKPLRFNMLVSQFSNEWKMKVEKSYKLANQEYCKKLVPLIESALDLTKSGEAHAKLLKAFRDLQKSYTEPTNPAFWTNPIDALRGMVPSKVSERIDLFDPDPQLNLENENPAEWRRLFKEGMVVMPEYNRRLRAAIEADSKPEGDDESRRKRWTDRSQSRADAVKEAFQLKYFGGGDHAQHMTQRLRASAWYVYGYREHKQSFAWLGARWLNNIKAVATNGGRPVPSVGSLSRQGSTGSQSSAGATAVEESMILALPVGPLSGREARLQAITEALNKRPAEPGPSSPLAAPSVSSPTHPCPLEDNTWLSALDSALQTMDTVEPSIADDDDKAPLPRVSIVSDPKPRKPVATSGIASCVLQDGHQWLLQANSAYRGYFCSPCGARVKEFKTADGYWCDEATKLALNSKSRSKTPKVLRESTITLSSTRSSLPPQQPQAHPQRPSAIHVMPMPSYVDLSERKSTPLYAIPIPTPITNMRQPCPNSPRHEYFWKGQGEQRVQECKHCHNRRP